MLRNQTTCQFESQHRNHELWTTLFLLASLPASSVASAQQVPTDPSSTHMLPAGGRRGTSVNVQAGGECIPPVTQFRILGKGLDAPPEPGVRVSGDYEPSARRKPSEQPVTHPTEWKSNITIAADASLSPGLWRLSCARGGTGGRPFIVVDLPEFIESESNSEPENAEQVELPVTINGQIVGKCDLD